MRCRFAAVLGTVIVASAYFLRPESLPVAAPPLPLPVTRFVVTPPATAPLTNIGGPDVMISPDGQRLVYIAQTDGGVALYMRELESLEMRRMPGNGAPDV